MRAGVAVEKLAIDHVRDGCQRMPVTAMWMSKAPADSAES